MYNPTPYRALQHAMRVLRILGVEDQIEGVIFCDYADPKFACKPEPEYFHYVRIRRPTYYIGSAPEFVTGTPESKRSRSVQVLLRGRQQDQCSCCQAAPVGQMRPLL